MNPEVLLVLHAHGVRWVHNQLSVNRLKGNMIKQIEYITSRIWYRSFGSFRSMTKMFIQVELSDIYITEGLSKISENTCQCTLECGTNHRRDHGYGNSACLSVLI